MAAEDAGEILGESRAGHDHVAAGFLGLDLEIALHVGNKSHNRGRFLEPGPQLGNGGQRLDAAAVQIHDDQRRFFFRLLVAVLSSEILFALDELHLHVELAGDFLNLGQEKQVVYQGKDARGGIFALGQGLEFASRDAIETPALVPSVLVAVTVVHGTDERRIAPLPAIVTVTAVLAVLPTTATLSRLVLSVLRLVAEVALATPLLPVSRAVRLVRCFIH